MNAKSIKTKEKKWILKSEENPEASAKAEKIASDLGINPIIAKLLYARGFTNSESAKSFLYMEREMLCNPFDMKDMDLAIARIKKAIDSDEKITIYGDYDVDGVTAVCTLYLYLQSKGANVDYYIPNRSGEGYGVSNTAIDALKESGTSLIITVDTGITAIEEVRYAKEVGIDFLVTDHHECRPELPEASAVINPHRPDCQYPFKELAGVGVVFKLISAYEEFYSQCSRIEAASLVFSKYADLVAIGTIADVMPIKSENRIIVSYGLKMIETTNRPGLIALIDASSATRTDTVKNDRRKKRGKISTGYIGYTLAPRINAAGRIRSASLSVELFLSTDLEKASKIAEELCLANKERQTEENKIMQEAYQKIEQYNMDKDPVIVLDADGWHHGVIGIVASRITEKYSRPTILVSFDVSDSPATDEDMGKGSGRSIKGLNLVDALSYCSDHLVKFGGHELAAGLSVTRKELPMFRKMINDYAKENLTDEDMIPTVEADCKVDIKEVNIGLAEELQILEPYGVGNPMPTFVMTGINVSEVTPVSNGKHTRLILGEGKNTLCAMYFSNSPSQLGVYVSDKIDILFNIDINEWLGKRSVQLIIKDIKPSESQDKLNASEHERFEEIWNGASFSREEHILPDRDDFALVYRHIALSVRNGNDTLSHKDITSALSRNHKNIGYIKLKIIIKIFRELNLVGIEDVDREVYKFKIHYSTTKTDLEKSNLLRRLRSQMNFK